MMYNWENATEIKGIAAPEAVEKVVAEDRRLRVAQINLRVADYEGMRDFYSRLLGERGHETTASEDREIDACVFELSNVNLMLIHQPEAAGGQELVFGLGENEAVDAAYNRMKHLEGCKLVHFPHYALDNRYEIVVEDPEGNDLIFRD